MGWREIPACGTIGGTIVLWKEGWLDCKDTLVGESISHAFLETIELILDGFL